MHSSEQNHEIVRRGGTLLWTVVGFYVVKGIVVTLGVLFLLSQTGCGAPAQKTAARGPAGLVAAPAPAQPLPRTAADPAWGAVPEIRIPLVPQDIAEPRVLTPNLAEIAVRALANAGEVAFRISWTDTSENLVTAAERYSDAVAVQFPGTDPKDLPDPAMGQKGKPVFITLWKAAYQDPYFGETREIQSLYPNAPPQNYPFYAHGGKGQENATALAPLFAPAVTLGNTVSVARNGNPVEDLYAEGFGNLSPTGAPADGRPGSFGAGSWKDGIWTVVLGRSRTLPSVGTFASRSLPDRTQVAFAVWDGAIAQRGARKMRTVWVPVTLGNPTP